MKNMLPKKLVINNNCLLLFILVLLLASCTRKENDYSIFPKNTVLTGKTKENATLYMIRENEAGDMAGTAFIYNQSAVVQAFSYVAYPSGQIYIQIDSVVIEAKAKIKPKRNTIILDIPAYPAYGIEKQRIKLKYLEEIPAWEEYVERYKDPIFDSIVCIKDIQYGKALGYYTSEPVDKIPHGEMKPLVKLILKKIGNTIRGRGELPLLMDIYMPYNDTREERPVFVYLHGGAFFFGDKQNLLQQTITDHLVKRGYVVASINYRLGSTLMGTDAIERTIYCGMQDTRAALKHIINNSEEWGIDTNQIYLGGSSAGGIIALTTAFMDKDNIFESVKNKRFRKKAGLLNIDKEDEAGFYDENDISIAGLISLWGAVHSLDIIKQKEDRNFPILLFHGTADDVVDCKSGLPFQEELSGVYNFLISSDWQLYGSSSICSHMNECNMSVEYIPFDGYGHEPQVDPDGSYNNNMYMINEKMVDFMHEDIARRIFNLSVAGNTDVYPSDTISVYYIENTNHPAVNWRVDGGYIVDRTTDSIHVLWYNTRETGKVVACVSDASGLCYKKELAVTINKP